MTFLFNLLQSSVFVFTIWRWWLVFVFCHIPSVNSIKFNSTETQLTVITIWSLFSILPPFLVVEDEPSNVSKTVPSSKAYSVRRNIIFKKYNLKLIVKLSYSLRLLWCFLTRTYIYFVGFFFRNVKNIKKLSETELKYNISGKASWHYQYKDSAWIFIGGLPYDLSEGDIICIFSQ